ncbi:MAG TPA: SPOR domain-containing protein, partial [Gemmatimonadales bacterium]|nr:SPOR domain-containing protein [Gemmatimonadales bacterium]
WSVQVAAARTRAEADPIAAGLVAGGLPARVVTSGGWFRVWVGDYGTMASADSARQSIRRRRGGAPFVVRQ